MARFDIVTYSQSDSLQLQLSGTYKTQRPNIVATIDTFRELKYNRNAVAAGAPPGPL